VEKKKYCRRWIAIENMEKDSSIFVFVYTTTFSHKKRHKDFHFAPFSYFYLFFRVRGISTKIFD
jgi:hypothetical protein